MDLSIYLGWIGLGLGIISRIFIPWLNERRLNPDEAKWSFRYIWPQIAAVVIAALALPLVPSIETVGTMGLAPAYLVGWGAGDIGRFIDKAITKQ